MRALMSTKSGDLNIHLTCARCHYLNINELTGVRLHRTGIIIERGLRTCLMNILGIIMSITVCVALYLRRLKCTGICVFRPEGSFKYQRLFLQLWVFNDRRSEQKLRARIN